MKKQFFTLIQTCLLVLTLGFWQTELYAQTPFTITWTGLGGAGTTNASGVPTGITIVQQYNGVTATCVTTPSNGATTSYNAVIKAAAGYNFTITSIGGSAYGSTAGSKKFTLQLTNGSVYLQPNFSTVGSSGSCGSSTTLNAFAVPAAGQTVTSGNQATVTVLRGIAGSESGGGYSYTRTLTITGVVTPVCDAPTGLLASALTSSSADLSWGAVSGSAGYQYVVDQTAANPAGAGTATSGTTYNATLLTPSTTYYLHVRNSCGGSNFSSWATIPFTTTAAAVCSTPTNLAENNVMATSSDFNWDAAGSNDFEYVLDQNAGNPAGAGTSINGISYSTSTLAPSTTYYFHLRQNCGGSFSNWVMVNFTTPAAPCVTPTGLNAANTSHNSSDLSWNAQGSNGFEYVVDQTSTAPSIAGASTTDTTYDATGLTSSTTYYLHVRTDCGSGNLSPWTTISFTTLVTPCIATTGLNAANTTHNSSDLSWNAQGSNGFEYVIDQTSTAPVVAGASTTDTTYDATGLTSSTTYYLHVRTDCGSGNLSPWTTISFTTLVTPCIATTGLNAANTTHNSSDLSWNAQGSNGFEYVIDQTSTAPVIAGTSTTDTTYDATGLTSSTVYYLHVRTDCGTGNLSPWTTISFTTLVTPCIATTGLTTTNTTHNSSNLSWDTQGSNGFEYVVDQTSTAPITAGTSTTGTTYNPTNLTPLTTYYLHVRTDCGNGNFSPWSTISFTTLITPCIAPTGLNAANTTHNSSDLSWNAQGSNDFEYVVNQTLAAPATAGTSTTDTTYDATGLISSTVYYLHVRTDCGNGNFSPWSTISFTTLVTPCAAPTGLNAANTTYNSSDLSWNAQGSNDFEYVVDQTATAPIVAGTSTTDTTYDATGLTASTVYYLHVRTDCGNGNFSPWTTISFTTLVTPCAAPTGLNAANTTHNSSNLSWNVQGGNDFEYVVNQTATAPVTAGTSTTGTTYNPTALAAATVYYLHVRTDCGNGNFSPWTTISFTTLAAPCAAPTGLNASNITGHAADLSWNTQTGSTFEYVINQTSASPTSSGTPTPNNAYAASTLTSLTTYYLHVRTNCGNGNFSAWTTIPFTTLSTVGLEEQEVIDLSVYPNPASDLVTISGQTRGTVTLVNLKGQRLITIDLKQINQLDLSAFESGIYFINYASENKTATIKLVKQ
ncbi:Exoglucanase B precursor [compost metagenome]